MPMIRNYIPLFSGLSVPIAAFLNMQAFIYRPISPTPTQRHNDPSLPLHQDSLPLFVIMLSCLALGFGILSVLALFVRMLEKKIKWSTRLVVFGSTAQGIICLCLLLCFDSLLLWQGKAHAELAVYRGASALLSFLSALSLYYYQITNESSAYVYLNSHLSDNTRRFVLLTISTLIYATSMACFYCFVENWDMISSLYFTIASLATIGIGDLVPCVFLGKVMMPFFTFLGIGLLASTIWSSRQILLEVLADHLAFEFAKSINLSRAQSASLISEALRNKSHSPLTRPSSPQIGRQHVRCHSIDVGGRDPADTLSGLHVGSLSSPHTMTVSRSNYLPRLTLSADAPIDKDLVHAITTRALYYQIAFAFFALFANLFIFGGVFAAFEGWNYWEGVYFSYCALTTIGYGDYSLKQDVSRGVFIWHIVFGIAATTYLGSMIAELALDQWVVATEHIHRRVDRYETKAQLKRPLCKVEEPSFPNALSTPGNANSQKNAVTFVDVPPRSSALPAPSTGSTPVPASDALESVSFASTPRPPRYSSGNLQVHIEPPLSSSMRRLSSTNVITAAILSDPTPDPEREPLIKNLNPDDNT